MLFKLKIKGVSKSRYNNKVLYSPFPYILLYQGNGEYKAISKDSGILANPSIEYERILRNIEDGTWRLEDS